MKTIKFRGQNLRGKMVYGDLYHSGNYVEIVDAEHYHIEVEPESVAQLVGYDKDGVEVYEGDSFDVQFSNEDETRHYVAELLPQATAENGCIFYDYHFKRNSIEEVNHRD